nr:heat shock protein 10 [Scrippsiella trochoidea]
MAASGVAKRFVPLLDRVLVQKVKAEAKTATGIFLPDSAKQAPNWAKVLAVGPGRRTKDGDLVPMGVKVGDTVVIPEYGGMTLKFDNEDFHVYRDEDCLGIVKDE